MSMPGVRSNNFPINSLADEVLTNRGGSTGRTPVARLAAQLQAAAGPTVALASDLNSVENLSWPKGASAKVVGDTGVLKGIWLKQGDVGSGPWTRIGPLPEGDTSELALVLAQLSVSTDQRFAEEAAERAAAIAQLIGGSPQLLDTFYEIAAAIGNDPNFAATILNALGLRLRVDVQQNLSAPQKLQGKANLDLEKVENTPDLNKPISELTQAALSALAADLSEEETIRSASDKIHDDKISGYGTLEPVDLSKKYARSGYDLVTFGTSGRIVSGLRRRDNVWVIGAGIETSDVRIVAPAKWNRSGVIAATVDKDGRLIQGQRARERLHEFGADGIKTRHQSWRGLPKERFSRSPFLSAEIGQDERIITGQRRDGVLYLQGSTVVRGDENGAPVEDYVVYTQTQGSETHIFSERKRDGRRLRLSGLGANHSDPQITRDGKVIWMSDGVLLWSPIDVAAQHRVVARPEAIGVGDSLTAQNFGADFTTLSGLPFRNIGKSAQTSLGCATRFGARPMRLVSVTGQIPASGSVQVASVDGLGVLDFYGADTASGIAGTVLGVPVTIGHDDATKVMALTRTTDGAAMPLPPGTPFIWTPIDVITSQPILNADELMGVFFFGRNNPELPDQIFADFKACVAHLKTLSKRYVIIPFMPTKDEVQGNQQNYRNWIYLMGLCLKEWPENTINMRDGMIAYAGSEAAYWSNLMQIDQTHPEPAGRVAIATIINNFRISKGW